jgi:hypothetical protein
LVFLICGHLDLKKSHFDSKNRLPDVVCLLVGCLLWCYFLGFYLQSWDGIQDILGESYILNDHRDALQQFGVQ